MSALCVLHFVLCCMISCGLSIRVVRFCITGFVSCCSCVSIYKSEVYLGVVFCRTSLFLLVVHILFFFILLGLLRRIVYCHYGGVGICQMKKL